jgi:hypothetical protein
MKTDRESKGCQYVKNSDFELLRLPYKSKWGEKLADLYFNLILPIKRFELNNVLKQLNSTTLIGMFNKLETRDVIVGLRFPKKDRPYSL